MATINLAQAVMKHAEKFYDVGRWYTIAECWDELSILDELERQEELYQTRFELETAAISHFAKLLSRRSDLH